MTSPATKRKAIDDFFRPVAKRTKDQRSIETSDNHDSLAKILTGDLSLDQATSVPGLTLYREFISPYEEQEILGFLNDSSRCSWRTDLSRRTMHFGGTYCLMPSKSDFEPQAKPQILQAPSMPHELSWLIQRMVDAHIFPNDKRPQYCIINEYSGNLGISAHTENFQFSEPVVGLSLLSPCPIRFHELKRPYDGSVRSGRAGKADKTGRQENVDMPGRSLLVIRGESRWKWQHEILRSSKGRGVGWKRISLTFRYKSETQTGRKAQLNGSMSIFGPEEQIDNGSI